MALRNPELPSSFQNEIVEIKAEKMKIRSNLKNVSDIKSWIGEYGRTTNTKWNLRNTIPSAQRLVCSHKYVCQHSSFNKIPSSENKRGISKNSNCPATITVKIKLDTKDVRRKDKYAKRGLFAEICKTEAHNHSLNTSETLRFLPSTNECRETFIGYFNNGMGISESWKYHEDNLEMQKDFNVEMLANSRTNPMYRTVQHWHEVWRKTNYGERTGPEMIAKLKEKIPIYGEEGITVLMNEDPFAILILTPLMRRAHKLEECENIVFVDSTSSCDAENHYITLMLIPCAAGSVPIAIIITKGADEKSYTAGFNLLKGALETSFNGKGYPSVFMTDKSPAEINALKNVWPESQNLLCIFHVAQAVWRWLWDRKNGILKEHRQGLMYLFRDVLYASKIQVTEGKYLNACGYVGTYLPTYENWNLYIEAWWNEKAKWCLAYRDHTIKGHHTNNFSEVCVRIFKDEVLSRVKAYNVLTLIDFSCNVLEKYFCRKLQKFAFSRNAGPRLLLEKMIKGCSDIKKEHILEKSGSIFEVQGSTSTYIVDIKSGVCSCEAGIYGKFCKHQCAIFHHFDAASKNFPPVLPENKHQVALLAMGEKCPGSSFFQPFVPPQNQLEEMDSRNAEMEIQSEASSITGDSEPLLCDSTEMVPEKNNDDLFSQVMNAFKACHEKFGSSKSGLGKIAQRMKKISSVGQWEKFLHTAGNSIPLRHRSGCSIKVQPTSIARRRPNVTKGCKRIPAGRPPTGVSSSKKRKHSLATNVKLQQPNAKLHGSGH